MDNTNDDFLSQRQARMHELIHIDDDYILFPQAGYDIALAHLDNTANILSWTHHLAEKSWMSAEILREFIGLACAHHRIALSPVSHGSPAK